MKFVKDWTVSLSNSYNEALTPRVLFRDRDFKEVMEQLNEALAVEP